MHVGARHIPPVEVYRAGIAPDAPTVTVYHGDCLDVLKTLPAESVHAICTDPPYGLEFMGATWDTFKPSNARIRTRVDGRTNPRAGKSTTQTPEAYVAGHPYQVWCQQWAAECLRVLKPGGYLAAFGGTRTSHRLACAIEDAGFEIRDTITWLYGSGFPKSLDVSKAIDKAAGAEREVVTVRHKRDSYGPGAGNLIYGSGPDHGGQMPVTNPATFLPKKWQGWGTALKPASEPIVTARKPFPGTVANNVLQHGCGALNIDACRIPAGQDYRDNCASVVGHSSNRNGGCYGEWARERTDSWSPAGRWPPNVVLSHAATPEWTDACDQGCVDGCPIAELDRQSGSTRSAGNYHKGARGLGAKVGGASIPIDGLTSATYSDSGGASRYFPVFRFQAKAPKSERPVVDGVVHPTVKPLALVEWLVTLITPPAGTVLDPFGGTGTTGQAAQHLGFSAILIEREARYLPLVAQRLTTTGDTLL